MRKRGTGRNSLFAKRWFADAVIILLVRWYLRFRLSHRDLAAIAAIFLRQALKRHGEPRSITLDGFEPSHTALRRMGMRNEFNFRWKNPVKIRSCKYLNNIVEQDHRRVKFRVSAMLGFKSFENARILLAGIELIQKLKKG